MAKSATILLVAAALLGLVSASLADQGTATYSTGTPTPSACFGSPDQGTMTAAASDALWNNGATCGTMYQVSCAGGTSAAAPSPCKSGTVTVKIVDRCPGCQATFDLSQEAFAAIASLDAGEILINYNRV